MVATAWSGSLNYATGIAPANAFGSAEIIASHPLHARHDHGSAVIRSQPCRIVRTRNARARWEDFLQRVHHVCYL